MKTRASNCLTRLKSIMAFSLLGSPLGLVTAHANPTGGTVGQGSATFNPSGSQLTITTSANAYINWQSFNIGAGETTTFIQPSDTSVVWNHINDPNPSQILGNLNANGYVILQSQSGFYVGGQASITAHGLILTTAANPAPTLSSGGAWDFNALPPTAKIINYGQINLIGGGSAFLIANDIENNGTLSAPEGNIGLYAGKQVLVSMSPDGRGLSAKVTLPQGSVDNEGNLIADGGTIAAQAQTVNQNGLAQANSVQSINGVIEFVASGSLGIGPKSDIEANGDSTADTISKSPGGFVVLQSGGTYADTPTSVVNVSGQNGGQNGIVEIFGTGSVQSMIGNPFASLINPYDLTLSFDPTAVSAVPGSSGNFNVSDLAAYSQIDLRALDSIELSVNWFLTAPSSSVDPNAQASLSVQGGNGIILDSGAGINAGNNWNVSLTAGTGFLPTGAQSTPVAGTDGIYLGDNAYIQTENGDINAWAANEIQIASDSGAGNDGMRTVGGGNIDATAQYGDINTGGNSQGYTYVRTAPFFAVANSLGGISTAAGGNVTITAGGNVTSYLPAGSTPAAIGDAGTGAFGTAPGDVTITAGGTITGHYVLANGVGTLTAGKDIGTVGDDNFALSLMVGTWNINAPDGNIYLQEVRNSNGVFNNTPGLPVKGVVNPAGQHLFNYSPDATVNLDAGIGVYLSDASDDQVPRPDGSVPVLYPPILNISAGSGGVNLEGNVTLFPSADQNLTITTTDGGNFTSPLGLTTYLFMSDSSQNRWISVNNDTFGLTDNSPGVPVQSGNPNPVLINISGDMENLTLVTSKETRLTVDGDMINCNFSGQNLHSSDLTSLTVGGQIFNQGAYVFVNGVTIPTVPLTDLFPGLASSWDAVIFLAMNPSALAKLTVPSGTLAANYLALALGASEFQAARPDGQWIIGGAPDLGFIYNPATGQLGFGGAMTANILTALSGPITILKLNNGIPVIDASGHFETEIINWAPPSAIQTLFTGSQGDPSPDSPQMGLRLGGPGQFDINAGSISLGDSYGILSVGVSDPTGGLNRFGNLTSITPSGATLNVTVAGDLDMLTSTIATLGGGDVNLVSTGGSMDLGTQGLSNSGLQVGYGVFSSGPGNVNITALDNINIDGSRVATYDGGNIFIESLEGNVDVGSGGNTVTGVYFSFVDPLTGQAEDYPEKVFGSGIVANTFVLQTADEGYPPDFGLSVATSPGNITVETPRGDITATVGGITQVSLNGKNQPGPTINLTAGTASAGTLGTPDYSPGYTGNIDLGQSGVIGGSVNITANGNISGIIISRENSDINAAQNFSGSVLAGGKANVTGGDSVVGVVIGVGGVNVSGSSVSATVLGQNVSVNGGASQSTLGSSATATATSQSAAQQSNTETKSEIASDDNESDDEKKKKKVQPLMQHVKRVTVILPKPEKQADRTPPTTNNRQS